MIEHEKILTSLINRKNPAVFRGVIWTVLCGYELEPPERFQSHIVRDQISATYGLRVSEITVGNEMRRLKTYDMLERRPEGRPYNPDSRFVWYHRINADAWKVVDALLETVVIPPEIPMSSNTD